jgi:DNA-directed RNA polymerase specialized sigma24 family protein
VRRDRQKCAKDFRSDYATHADFCEALTQDTNSLYLLAFLLTTNHEDAEHCFAATVEEVFKRATVFRDWASTWIRHTLIIQAIMIVFDPNRHKQNADSWYSDEGESGLAIDAINSLADLDRFVFVMLVLERYSIHECSLFLGCSSGAVIQSRERALSRLPALMPA